MQMTEPELRAVHQKEKKFEIPTQADPVIHQQILDSTARGLAMERLKQTKPSLQPFSDPTTCTFATQEVS